MIYVDLDLFGDGSYKKCVLSETDIAKDMIDYHDGDIDKLLENWYKNDILDGNPNNFKYLSKNRIMATNFISRSIINIAQKGGMDKVCNVYKDVMSKYVDKAIKDYESYYNQVNHEGPEIKSIDNFIGNGID